MKKYLILVLCLVLAGCAVPNKSSLRNRMIKSIISENQSVYTKDDKMSELNQMEFWALLSDFAPEDQLRLMAMLKYIDHSIFQAALKRKEFTTTSGVKDIDLLLHYQEYLFLLKDKLSSIDDFMDNYIKEKANLDYINITQESCMDELKMKMNRLEQFYRKYLLK